MTERSERPFASHVAFPYYFDSTYGTLTFPYSFPFAFAGDITPNKGICFGDLVVYVPPTVADYKYKYDLALYYGDLQNTYVEGRCSRWDVQDYSIIIGTWIKKDDLQNIRDNIRPGAVRQLNRVVYAPKFYDATFRGLNTIRFLPTPSSSEMNQSNLHNMRRDTIAYCKTITEHPIQNSEWIELKLECNISSNQEL